MSDQMPDLALMLDMLAAQIGIEDGQYTALVVLDERADPLEPWVFSLDEAVEEIQRRGIRPADGMVYLVKADSVWNALRNRVMEYPGPEKGLHHE